MNSPEVAKEKFEVDFFAVQQNGWDDSTHGVSWYYRDADQYARAGQIFSTSKAGREFRKTRMILVLKLFLTPLQFTVLA